MLNVVISLCIEMHRHHHSLFLELSRLATRILALQAMQSSQRPSLRKIRNALLTSKFFQLTYVQPMEDHMEDH